MKFLVLAADAQSGVGAGSKGVGQPAKACRHDPTPVETQVRDGRSKAFCYGLGREPASDTNRVGCSVACLEREGWKKVSKPHLNWPFKCGQYL
ncbi:MAG: hypothetical protein L5655_02330 [Thermosediminibacteraceae bacterium]|nr:hypothetical protein [Thermosediminibacteraceae bacterium]